MDTEDALTSLEKEQALIGWSESVKSQLAEGIHKDDIVKQITDTGLEHDAAAEFVEKCDQTMKDPFADQKALAKKYSDEAGFGGWWILGSVLLSIIGGFFMSTVPSSLSIFMSLLVVIAFLWGLLKFVYNIALYYLVKWKIPKPSKS